MCLCNYLCALVGIGGGEEGRCLCVPLCVPVNLNLKMEMHMCWKEHCSSTQCTMPLTFQLCLSACTKAFLQALTCVNLLLTRRDSRGHMWADRVLPDLLHDLSLSLSLSCINKMRPQLNECPNSYFVPVIDADAL